MNVYQRRYLLCRRTYRQYQGHGSEAPARRHDARYIFGRRKRLFDTTKLQCAAFKPLSDEQIFAHPTLFHGVITWNHGEIDIAPETVYRESLAYNEDHRL